MDYIKSIESSSNELFDYSSTAHAFTDKILSYEKFISKNLIIDFEEEKVICNSIAPPKKNHKSYIDFIEDEIKNEKKDKIVLGSKVKVKFLNNDKDIFIHIVEFQFNKLENTSDIQKLNYKTPLASSIIGKSVGDIVKIGNLDRFVEIVEILN
ncbi:MAG: GreA/GreB family elongation factor [Saprospiraceae bacterium]|nr:GreA/GreB family elongation factor [Saprospiraceae bacterium]